MTLTYGGLEKLGDRCPELPFFPEEDGIGAAGDTAPCTHAEIVYRAYHVIELHEERTPGQREQNSSDEGTDETFLCLLW